MISCTHYFPPYGDVKNPGAVKAQDYEGERRGERRKIGW